MNKWDACYMTCTFSAAYMQHRLGVIRGIANPREQGQKLRLSLT